MPRCKVIQPDGHSYFDDVEGLTQVQRLVAGNIEVLPVREQFTVYANEDGYQLDLPENKQASKLVGYKVVGTVVVFGPPNEEGEDTAYQGE